MQEKRKSHWTGGITLLALCLFVCFLAWRSGMMWQTVNDLLAVWTGSPYDVAEHDAPFTTILGGIVCITVLDMIVSIPTMILVMWYLPKPRENPSFDFGKNYHFLAVIAVVLLEELYARWFFLGLLPQIPFLSGTAAFYVLLLLGNGSWAALHLKNYTHAEDRNFVRVLPQFMGGCVLAGIFVKHGLFAAVMAHLLFNMVFFSVIKKQQPNSIDGCIAATEALMALVAFLMMDKPLADMAAWFQDNPTFALAGWYFWDYIVAVVFISSCASALSELVCFDRNDRDRLDSQEDNPGLLTALALIPIAIAAVVVGALLMYALLSVFTDNVHMRILLTAVMLCGLQKQESFSGVARTFWITLPNTFMVICIFHALGWLGSIAHLASLFLIGLPSLLLVQWSNARSKPMNG